MKNIPIHRFRKKISKWSDERLIRKSRHIYSVHQFQTTDYLGAIIEEFKLRNIQFGG